MDWNLYFVQGFEFIFLGVGTYFDLKDRELPGRFLGFFVVLGLICNVIWKYQSIDSVIVGACIGMAFLFAGWVTKEAIGYGDGIGLIILGIFEGWKGLSPIVITAFLLSGIYGLWSLIGGGKSADDIMPFYPFLLLSFLGVLLL